MEIKEEVKKIRVTDELVLKEIELSDASDIFSTIDSQREYLGKWLPFVDFTKCLEDSVLFVGSVLDTPPENRELLFVILYKNTFAGLIGFKDSDFNNHKTEIGYWLSAPLQNKGIMTMSVKALIKLSFDELFVNRIQIKCAVGNQRSRKIPQKLGFVFEGIERDGELLSGGKYVDIEVYSLLKKEYCEKRQNWVKFL